MAIDSEQKRWAMHAFASTPAIRNTVFNPATSGLDAIERATTLRYGGTIAWQTLTPGEGGVGPVFLFEWIWDRFGV